MGQGIAPRSGTSCKGAQSTSADMREKDAECRRNIAAAETTGMVKATIMAEITADSETVWLAEIQNVSG